MELWIGAINLGFLYSFMALGIFITYRIYDFPDITVDGSFTTGASVASILILDGWNPFLVIPAAFLAGAAAGFLTGIIHTRFKISGLLSGILVMTGLYSINLRIMGKSNIPLLNFPSFISFFEKFNPGLNSELWLFVCLTVIIGIFWLIISLFFSTDFGVTMRATGDNPIMVSASGVNVDFMKVFGIALANGLVGISGGLVAQYQGFADIGMGVGAIVFSMAAVIIGEAIIKKRSIYLIVLGVIAGSVIFRLMVALALFVGLNPNDLKLITAFFVFLTLIISGAFGIRPLKSKLAVINFKRYKKIIVGAAAVLVLALGGYFIANMLPSHVSADKIIKIGIVMPNDAEILTLTRDGLKSELKALGYEEGKNCRIIEQNANGDIPTVSTIVDNFINQDVDIFLPISTVSTQVVTKKIKNKPVIFATVASPFIIGVGKSDTDHPENITGVYGLAPVSEMVSILKEFMPGKIKLGVIWNASYPNSVYNVEALKKALEGEKNMTMVGATISSSNEIFQAAQSLAGKGIDVFFLIPDLTVYASFESIVKAARQKKLPIFTNDTERLKDGALLAYGYDYYSSGKQTAHLLDRIIKGESPAKIPYEKHKHLTLGINIDEAQKLGINIPETIKGRSTVVYKNGVLEKNGHSNAETAVRQQKRVAVFQFTDNNLLNQIADGALDELKKSASMMKYDLIIERKNANGDFGVSQSISKDMVSKNYDYIFTISTLSLQATANNNKLIPHVFCGVTDPIKAGVAKSFTSHPPNLTGLATPQPVEATIKLMREMFPSARRIGLIWNPSEINSEICTRLARETAKKYNFTLVEKTISNTNEIEEALKAVINEKIDLFFTSGDVTVSVAIPSVAKTLRSKRIPYFTNAPSDIKLGAYATIGADYFTVGAEAAKILERVVNGENTASIPIIRFVPELYYLNSSLVKEYKLNLPEAVIKKANKIF